MGSRMGYKHGEKWRIGVPEIPHNFKGSIWYGSYDRDHIIWTILPHIPWKDLMCYKCHNWSNPSHSNCLQPDNETPLVNCTEMYDGYELGQVVCESSEWNNIWPSLDLKLRFGSDRAIWWQSAWNWRSKTGMCFWTTDYRLYNKVCANRRSRSVKTLQSTILPIPIYQFW